MVAISMVAITIIVAISIVVVAIVVTIVVAIIVVPSSTESVNEVVQSVANVVPHICTCGGTTKCKDQNGRR